mmetsp:Transcript_12972/g.19381  ORF Transcript_12972/g.19381 Transcript_12972/m.19381 type:complete len:225 (-) Transcript_12972:16-690(-)
MQCLPQLHIRTIFVAVKMRISNTHLIRLPIPPCHGWLCSLQHNQLSNIVLRQLIQNGCPLFTSRIQPHPLSNLPLCQLIEFNTVRFHQMKFRPTPEQRTSVHLSSHSHCLSRFLLVYPLKACLVHCIIEMAFVVICLHLLQANNIWSYVNYLSDDILESKVPRQSPKISIRILLLRRINLRQNIISHNPKPRSPTPRRLGRYQIPLLRFRSTTQYQIRLDHTMH